MVIETSKAAFPILFLPCIPVRRMTCPWLLLLTDQLYLPKSLT